MIKQKITNNGPPDVPFEAIAQFSFLGVTEWVAIGQEGKANWRMSYVRVDGYEQATVTGLKSRAAAIQAAKKFMEGHGPVLISNLLESAEKRRQEAKERLHNAAKKATRQLEARRQEANQPEEQTQPAE